MDKLPPALKGASVALEPRLTEGDRNKTFDTELVARCDGLCDIVSDMAVDYCRHCGDFNDWPVIN